jgi:hypothetical protein
MPVNLIPSSWVRGGLRFKLGLGLGRELASCSGIVLAHIAAGLGVGALVLDL